MRVLYRANANFDKKPSSVSRSYSKDPRHSLLMPDIWGGERLLSTFQRGVGSKTELPGAIQAVLRPLMYRKEVLLNIYYTNQRQDSLDTAGHFWLS